MVAQQFTLQSCINIAGSMISWGLCVWGGDVFWKLLAVNEWACLGGGGGTDSGNTNYCYTHTEHSHPLFRTKGASYHGNAVFGLMYGWAWNSKRVWASGEQTDTLALCSLILTILSWNNCCTYVRVRRPKDKGKARERTEQRWWYLEIPSARGELMRSPIFLHGSATEVEALHGLPHCFCAIRQPPN